MDDSGIGRRAVIQGALTAPLAGMQLQRRDATLIQRENRLAGAQDWQLSKVRLDKRNGFRAPDIEGYCSHQSIEAGETLRIMVSAPKAWSVAFRRWLRMEV